MGGIHEDRGRNAAAAPVILLGGHYAALSVARALYNEGLRVMVVSPDPRDHACHSRFASGLLVAPDPTADSDGLLAAMLGAAPDWDGALVIPTLDEYVTFVSQHREELGRRFRFAVPSPDIVEGIIDKSLLYPTAREAGVPIPAFFVPDSLASLDATRESLRFPCILKPFESREFSEIYGAKVLVARDFAELAQKYADARRRGLEVMVCEIIPGEDSTIFSYHCYIDSRGELLAEMSTQKLRQYPSGFGQGAVVRTVPVIPEIRAHALRLLAAAGYRGESSTEFRLDSRDGQYKLMETNARPIVYERLFVEAGIDFPYITYRDLILDERVFAKGYETDLRWIHNHWEIVNFLRRLRTGQLHLKEYLAAYGKRRVYAIPLSGDAVNFVREVGHNARLALERIGQHGA